MPLQGSPLSSAIDPRPPFGAPMFVQLLPHARYCADLGDLDFLAGSDLLTEYQFNSMTAKHYFCSKCGIYTHHQRRSNPRQYGVNVACLAGLSPFDFDEILVSDGVNHPSDVATDAPPVAGTLKFIRRK